MTPPKDQAPGLVARRDAWLIVKRDLFYRPNAQGYTGIRDHAGRYTLDEVARHYPNIDHANQDGITFVHEDDAPEFTSACFHDLKSAHLMRQRDAAADRIEQLEAENAELRGKLEKVGAALSEAADDIEAWGAYADDYFQQKHDLEGCVLRARSALTEQANIRSPVQSEMAKMVDPRKDEE